MFVFMNAAVTSAGVAVSTVVLGAVQPCLSGSWVQTATDTVRVPVQA